MHISLPQQALCVDRQKVTRGPDPGRWLVTALPADWSVHSLHFFVNWTQDPPAMGKDLWVTRLVNFEANEAPDSVSADDVASAFEASVHACALEAAGRIGARYGQQTTAILLPDIPVASVDDRTPVWMIPYSGNGSRKVIVQSIAALKAHIRRESGGPVQVGAKGLTYGTSAVECVLSHSDSAYPGDVDAVIVDGAGVIRCVAEYKKHTLDDALGNHLMNRYYPKPDGRKYRRLQSLVLHYRHATPEIPFVMLYYSTKKPIIRLQEIGDLLPDRATIARDSGDMNIRGLTEAQAASLVVEWLGLTP